MKRFIYTLVAICFSAAAYSQDITGLWKGTLFNDSTKQSLPYEVFISKENGKLTGYSHICFVINDKSYFGVKKVKVRVAKDGKILIQDAALIEHNYPSVDKNIFQINVLNFVMGDNETMLDGPFATNRTKNYGELTGHINLKKATVIAESSLMQYLQQNGIDNGIAAVK